MMTFTYTPAAADDVTRCRFHIGDTDEAAAIFSDEEIQFAIDEAGGWRPAVIWLIQNIIAQISATGSFTADWLKIDAKQAIDGYQALILQKRRELGVKAVRSSAKGVSRSDGPPY